MVVAPLVIAAAGLLGIWLPALLLRDHRPIAIAVLGTALTIGAVDWLEAQGSRASPRRSSWSSGARRVLRHAGVGRPAARTQGPTSSDVVDGIDQIQDWAKTGPLKLTDNQIQDWIDNAKESITNSDTSRSPGVSEVGTTLTHLVAGFFIALFASFFFLYEGERIWSWSSRCSRGPRATGALVRPDGVGFADGIRTRDDHRRLTDAMGIAFGAWVLGVPLTFAIGVLVFLGAFIPIIGALLSGMVAVLVALVAQGPWSH